MEKYGIYYFFRHELAKHTLVLVDDPNSHVALGQPIEYNPDTTDFGRVDDHVWGWSADLQLQSGAVAMRDYNFTTPTSDLTAKSMQTADHRYANLEVYDYAGPYGTVNEGQKLASVRMQEIAR